MNFVLGDYMKKFYSVCRINLVVVVVVVVVGVVGVGVRGGEGSLPGDSFWQGWTNFRLMCDYSSSGISWNLEFSDS